ncbi:MAG TPA: methyltransferase domain-containing protein [Actinomycetales bacterium]|nr:methyltransferase domain-containing protein [Actinomycetales bacterium]
MSHPAHDLRELVRREVAGRQLAAHLGSRSVQVLDVAGGADALRLARAGHHVLAVEPDEPRRLALARSREAEPAPVRSRLTVVDGALGRLVDVVGDRRFDAVTCHEALASADSPRAAVIELCDLVAAGGVVSLVAPNADGLALRPAREGRWADALDLLAAADDPEPRYLDGSAAAARAYRLEELASYVAGRRMHVEAWYGIGLLTDMAPLGQPAPCRPEELDAVVAAENLAGRTDPYRRMAPLVHLVGRRMKNSTEVT